MRIGEEEEDLLDAESLTQRTHAGPGVRTRAQSAAMKKQGRSLQYSMPLVESQSNPNNMLYKIRDFQGIAQALPSLFKGGKPVAQEFSSAHFLSNSSIGGFSGRSSTVQIRTDMPYLEIGKCLIRMADSVPFIAVSNEITAWLCGKFPGTHKSDFSPPNLFLNARINGYLIKRVSDGNLKRPTVGTAC